MSSTHQRNMVENEVVFRKYNETVQHGLEELQVLAQQEDLESLMLDNDMEIQFYCECSGETCTKRVHLKLNDYTRIHEDRKRFVLAPGHHADEVEKIVPVPKTATKLKPTDINN